MIFGKRKPAPRPVPVTLFSGGGGEGFYGRDSFLGDMKRVVSSNIRIKPRYADCWLIGSSCSLDIIEEYDTPSGHVVIGTASDGETEYNLTPSEYSATELTNTIVEEAIEEVRARFRENGGRTDRQAVDVVTSEILSDHMSDLVAGSSPKEVGTFAARICDIVYRYSVGLGVFDILLADPKLEDIYIDAPCDRNPIHVTLGGVGGGNAHLRCRTNLVVEKKEVMNLVNVVKRESGLPFCESNPVLEADMAAQDARVTIVGYPMSPNGDAVAIRKRARNPWTLTRLISNGTITAQDAGLLSFLVQNRATFLICGARGAGKSSLLSALMFEFPLSQRILTIEDTVELPGEAMREMGYKVQSMLIDERMEGDSRSRSAEALRVSLRLGESAIVLGEVRGDEARVLYESMRTGKAGSAILGTIHGDSARTVFERVVHDMGISAEAFMATDILVTVGSFRDRKTDAQSRRVSEIVATTDRPGIFRELSSSEPDLESPVMRRAMASCSISEKDALNDIRARALLHAYLAELGTRYGEEYYSPAWIAMANSQIARMAGKTADEILASFKQNIRERDRI